MTEQRNGPAYDAAKTSIESFQSSSPVDAARLRTELAKADAIHRLSGAIERSNLLKEAELRDAGIPFDEIESPARLPEGSTAVANPWDRIPSTQETPSDSGL